MTIEEFNSLDEQSKRVIIFEADKVEEIERDFEKFELFSIDDFFIEVKTNRLNCIKRTIATYKLNKLPSDYSYTHFLFSNRWKKIS